MADSPTLSGRDRPVGASDSAPIEETIQGLEQAFTLAYDQWREALVESDPQGYPWAPGTSADLFQEFLRVVRDHRPA